MSDDDKKGCTSGDEVLVGPNIGGLRPFVRHRADHQIECGVAPEGDPEEGGLKLQHQHGNLYSVVPEGTSKGPAQVATKTYRDNWDTIFGGKAPIGQA